MTAPEPLRLRWGRRARTIPIVLGATALGLALSPVLVAAAVVADVVKGRRRLPTARVVLFALQYGVNDSVEILLAPVYWVMAGFGTRLGSAASIARHQRVQRWSIDVLARRAERLLGVRFELDPACTAALGPGPVIVLCRHVSIVDASLPALLYQRIGLRVRGVIMAELLADPGFDLFYGRTGSVFVPRDNGPEARATVREMGRTADDTTAVVIFPEGRLFGAERLARAMDRLVAENPERAARLAGLGHVLPPRPGGVLALLDAVTADVVVIAHAGLDPYPAFADLARAAPLADPIRVTAWRVPRREIPAGDAERIVWLDEQWRRVDRWVAEA